MTQKKWIMHLGVKIVGIKIGKGKVQINTIKRKRTTYKMDKYDMI